MFSVVLPAYNCEDTIITVIKSILQQTRFDLIDEIIVINDGSTDNTGNVIKEFIDKNVNTKVIYIEQDNHGVSYTRNRAIKMARAEWIALIDSDDVWLPNKIEHQVYYLNQNSNIVFMGADANLRFLFFHKKGLYNISPRELCIRYTPDTSSIIFKRKIGIELGLFNEGMKYCEDINFFQRFLLKKSYYVLCEKLVEIAIGKEYFGQSGLSSNLYKMHMGRKQNTKELYEMGLISKGYALLTQFCNELKYLRRCLLQKLSAYKSERKRLR